jgi:hypothetical protein
VLYKHCESRLTPAQFLKFLDALEHSRNLPALLILDQDRQINPVPYSVNIPPLEPTHICTLDVARILHDRTQMPARWTILIEALELDSGHWYEVMQKSRTHPLLEVTKFIFDTWSGHLGITNSTVGGVCDSLHSVHHPSIAGKENLEFNGKMDIG